MNRVKKSKILLALIAFTAVIFGMAIITLCGVFNGGVNSAEAATPTKPTWTTVTSRSDRVQPWGKKSGASYTVKTTGTERGITKVSLNGADWVTNNTAYFQSGEGVSQPSSTTTAENYGWVNCHNEVVNINVRFNVGELLASAPTTESTQQYSALNLGFVADTTQGITCDSTGKSLGLSIQFIVYGYKQLRIFIADQTVSGTENEQHSIVYKGEDGAAYPDNAWVDGGFASIIYALTDWKNSDVISIDFTLDTGVGSAGYAKRVKFQGEQTVTTKNFYKLTVNPRAEGFTADPWYGDKTHELYFYTDYLSMKWPKLGRFMLALEGWKSGGSNMYFKANPYIYVGSNNAVSTSYFNGTGTDKDGYTKINGLSVYGDRVTTNEKYKLDGLKVYLKTPSYRQYSTPQSTFNNEYNNFTFGFVNDKNALIGEILDSVSCNIWPYHSPSNGLGGRIYFTRGHEKTNAYTVGYGDHNLFRLERPAEQGGNLGAYYGSDGTNAYAFTEINDEEMGSGLSLQFNYHPEWAMWSIDVVFLNCTVVRPVSRTVWVSDAYFRQQLDADGKAYLQVYGFVGKEYKQEFKNWEQDLWIRIEESKTITWQTSSGNVVDTVGQGQEIKAPDTGSYNGAMLVGYKDANVNNSLYPVGQIVSAQNANLTMVAKYLDYQIAGAGVQKGGGYGGIRFGATMSRSSLTALEDGGAVTVNSVGIVMIPTDLIPLNTEFDKSTAKVQTFTLNRANFETAFGGTNILEFYGTIKNLYGRNYSRPISARTFVDITYNCAGQSFTKTIYGDYDTTNNSKSIYSIAATAIQAGETDNYKVMGKYVDAIPFITYENSSTPKTIQYHPITGPNYTSVVTGMTSASIDNSNVFTLTFTGTSDFKTYLDFTDDAQSQNYGFQTAIVDGRRADIISQTITEKSGGYEITIKVKRPAGKISEDMINFFVGDTVYNEPVVFVAETKGGYVIPDNIVGVPRANLSLPATEIISAKWYLDPTSTGYQNRVNDYASNINYIADMTNDSFKGTKYELKIQEFNEGEHFELIGGDLYLIGSKSSCGAFLYNDAFISGSTVTVTGGYFMKWSGIPFITDAQILGYDGISEGGITPFNKLWSGMNANNSTTNGTYWSNDVHYTGTKGATANQYRVAFSEGRQIMQYQVYITYKHDSSVLDTNNVKIEDPRCRNTHDFNDIWTTYQGDSGKPLAKSVNALKTKTLTDGKTMSKSNTTWDSNNSFNVLVIGDSIASGCHTSDSVKMGPDMERYSDLLVDALASYYNLELYSTAYPTSNKYLGEIQLRNFAWGGCTSSSFLVDEGARLSFANMFTKNLGGGAGQDPRGLKDWRIDLCIIAFGMNDATADINNEQYIANITTMIGLVKDHNANAEFILVGTMEANSRAKDVYRSQGRYTKSDSATPLKDLARSKNCAYMDMSVIQNYLMMQGKSYYSLTSNGVNHTNDFMARIYAQQMFTMLAKYPLSNEIVQDLR